MGRCPVPQAQVKLKQRDVTIANLQKNIADADRELAATLMRFQKDLILNVDLWNKLAIFAQRPLKRYIDLGARFAWFSERALSYEQARPIDIVKLNYFPTFLRGLTGADGLLADLSELEAMRLEGLRLTAPIKHRSLAREFPVQFGRLKQFGEGLFHTSEATLRTAYPARSSSHSRRYGRSGISAGSAGARCAPQSGHFDCHRQDGRRTPSGAVSRCPAALRIPSGNGSAGVRTPRRIADAVRRQRL